MPVHFKYLGLAIVASALLTVASKEQEPPLSIKAYTRTGQEASLAGIVTLTGKPPKPLRIDMSADPSCYESNPDPKTEWFVVRNKRLANVLVYATSETVLDKYWFAPPTSPASLEHKGCRYEPHVLGIQKGQPLSIVHNDATVTHNTHPTPKFNLEWNQTQVAGAPPIVKTFEQTEVAIPFKDNQHPWEKAYVGVFSHPFFAVSDADGNFRIEGLPPGAYTIKAWHEKLGERTVDVVFVSSESRFVEFNFEVK
ncbi:MAG TPA: carboxypeptidase regulatory-like domain-containing protein [Pyrinomonadaceae bacterium]|nr:carboxypeptidase regulatory-like domain-containing protein [Pyrinomonadaceae bacterium]